MGQSWRRTLTAASSRLLKKAMTHKIKSSRLNSPVRNNPRLFLHLLSLMLGSQFVHGDVAQARGEHPAFSSGFRATANEAHTTQEGTTLELGNPVERELSGGQKHIYHITVQEGHHVRVDIKPQGISLGVSLQLPDGKTSVLYEPILDLVEMLVERVAESSGTYSINIYTRNTAPIGRYTIRLSELRPAIRQLQPVAGDRVVAGRRRGGDESESREKNETRVLHGGEIISPFPCRESPPNSAPPSGTRRTPAPSCSWHSRSRRPPSRCRSVRPTETRRRARRP